MKTNDTRFPRLGAVMLAAALACAFAPTQASAWPWGGEQAEGNGAVKRHARQVANFNGISMAVPGQMELRMGNTESVTIETDDNIAPLIETTVDNGVLRIRPTKRNLSLRTQHLKIIVQARQIDSVALGGSGNIEADVLRAPRLKFDLGGSGRIHVQELHSDAIAISVGGSGSLAAGGGRANKVSVSIGGSGNVDLGKVAATEATVRIGGSGNVKLWARDTLSVSIAGSGNVSYYGDPKLSSSMVGSGSTRRLGTAP